MKKIILGLLISVMLVMSVSLVMAKGMGKGWPYYVDVEVDWDGDPNNMGDWNVYAQQYFVDTHTGYSVGDLITGCSACLDMSSYNFVCKGNTLQFDETYVEGVNAYPQTHHVVLHDNDGDSVYTGFDTARYDYQGSIEGTHIRMDVLEYEVEVGEGCTVTDFHYIEHEYVHFI